MFAWLVKDILLWKKAFNIDADIQLLSVIIWTTTPWTLPSNQAISVGKDIDYLLVKTEKEYVVVAKELCQETMQRGNISSYDIMGECKGESLVQLEVKHPLDDRYVSVLLGDHVTTETGTGVVHIAPDHGIEDFELCQKYQIGTLHLVEDNGVFSSSAQLIAGMFYLKSNITIINILKDRHTLWHNESFIHSYPHCWRHKTPVIFRATPQWFIAMHQQDLLKNTEKLISQVQWIPTWGKTRMQTMIKNRPDWCISRQRTWGVPLPIFVHKITQEIHPNTTQIMRHVADLVEKQGVDAWFELDKNDFLGDQAENYSPVVDILDVWFDSGISFYATKKYKNIFCPIDLYLEGSDQFRGWFHTALLLSSSIYQKAPYKQVLTHGFAVDQHGYKMSKSAGNVINPQEINKTWGADILRLWVATVDYRSEITLSNDILKHTSDIYRRIRNTIRFLLANLNGFNMDQHAVPYTKMLALDQWAVNEAFSLQDDIKQAYHQYEFHVAAKKIHDFCAQNMSGFYLDIIKDRQYTCQENSIARRSTQTAIYHILHCLVHWIAPILCFTAEEVWEHISSQEDLKSIFLSTWYKRDFIKKDYTPIIAQSEWFLIKSIKDQVNKCIEQERQHSKIRSGLEAKVVISVNQDILDTLVKLKNEFRFVLIVSQVELKYIEDDIIIKIEKASGEKCARCWHYRDDVGECKIYPDICQRCIDNAFGDGEERCYA